MPRGVYDRTKMRRKRRTKGWTPYKRRKHAELMKKRWAMGIMGNRHRRPAVESFKVMSEKVHRQGQFGTNFCKNCGCPIR